MTALLLAAAFACGAALPAMAEQATPETAAQPDPTEWADEAQDVTEAEEAPVYQQADAQEVATGETAASLTVTAADCTAQFIDEAYRLFLPVNTDMAALTIETGAELAAADAEGLTVDGTTVSGDFTNIETLTFAGADDVDLIASSENVSLEDIADVHAGNIVQTELTKGALRSDVCFVEVAFGCLVDLLGAHFAKAKLDCLIAVGLDGFLLHDGAGAGFDDGYGNDLAVFIKQLGHAQFLANDTFLHLCKSSCKGYWLAAGCPPT